MKPEALAAMAPAAPAPDHRAKTAAKQLESLFLRQLLTEALPKGKGMLDGGFAGDTFNEMLNEALADKMASAGGIGIAKMFAKQLGTPGAGELAPQAFGPSIDGLQLTMPVPGHVGSGFGPRVGHSGETHQHKGLDLTAKLGDPVAAAAGGTIEHAGPAGTYGNLVIVKHGDGYSTRYGHLSAVAVRVGEKVTAGQQVGKAGSTGLSDGPHLHFEVRKGAQAIDPTALLPLNKSRSRTSR